ncbi:hypothetical protein SBA5_70106 [Candidatus Sulfotelmatomonas gaucii]|uniref:Uncharacterized protein n=1 Tax=Candidatus Sulfuritelmatomonas gaucii TaxID=2043161 RepID=A0A2N9M0L7_9BACT|nr:hypothetical protein SBA5_70106 [Candidatus Sulfotelmatomonas gaucii]
MAPSCLVAPPAAVCVPGGQRYPFAAISYLLACWTGLNGPAQRLPAAEIRIGLCSLRGWVFV